MIKFYKLIVDILYEGYDKWWPVEEITAETLGMDYDMFMNKKIHPENSRMIECEHVKTFVPYVRDYLFVKKETILMTEQINNVTCYKIAIKGDEAYLSKYLKNRKRINNYAVDRYDKILENVRQNGLLSEEERKELELIEN